MLFGSLQDAIPVLEEALAKERMPPAHSWNFAVRYSLFLAYNGVGRYDEAANLVEELQSQTDTAFTPEHPRRIEALHFLGVAYKAIGETDMAIEFA